VDDPLRPLIGLQQSLPSM